jgi:hypothetical protein
MGRNPEETRVLLLKSSATPTHTNNKLHFENSLFLCYLVGNLATHAAIATIATMRKFFFVFYISEVILALEVLLKVGTPSNRLHNKV